MSKIKADFNTERNEISIRVPNNILEKITDKDVVDIQAKIFALSHTLYCIGKR